MKHMLQISAALTAALLSSVGHAEIVTTVGNTTGAPVFNRALEDLSDLSQIGTAVRYGTYSFSVDTSGDYSFLSTARFDNFVFLYSPAFASGSPLVNARAGNDDMLGVTTAGFQYALVAGATYTFVTTGYELSDFGAFSTTIGGPGTITATSATPPAAAVPEIVTYVGNTTSSPSFNRALEDLSDLSAIGTNVRYDSYHFRVAESGSYTFLSTAMFDNFVFLYSASLDPAHALVGAKAGSDDLFGTTTAGFEFALIAGVDYEFVTTGYENSDFGAFSNTISGPGAVFTTSVPEPETYALMLAGLAAIGYARRRSSVAKA